MKLRSDSPLTSITALTGFGLSSQGKHTQQSRLRPNFDKTSKSVETRDGQGANDALIMRKMTLNIKRASF